MTPTPVTPNPGGWIALFELVCTAAAALAAWWVIFRDGGWRRAGDHKRVADQAARAEVKAENWHQSPEAKSIIDKLAAHSLLLSDHANALEDVATKEDIAKLEGQLKVTQEKVIGAAAGIDRVEGILIKRALEA